MCFYKMGRISFCLFEFESGEVFVILGFVGVGMRWGWWELDFEGVVGVLDFGVYFYVEGFYEVEDDIEFFF